MVDRGEKNAEERLGEYEEPRLIDLGSLEDVTRGFTQPHAKDNVHAMGTMA